MKIYLAHGRGGSQHSKEIFHLARTAKRAGHTTHCINDTDTETRSCAAPAYNGGSTPTSHTT